MVTKISPLNVIMMFLCFSIGFHESAQPQNIKKFEKTYGGDEDDVGYKIIKNGPSKYAISGYSASFSPGVSGGASINIYAFGVDTCGLLLCDASVGKELNEEGWSLVRNSSGNFAITGFTTSSFANGSHDTYTVALSATAGTNCSVSFVSSGTKHIAAGGSDRDENRDIVIDGDGKYVTVGFTEDQNNNDSRDMYLTRFSSTGSHDASWAYGGSDVEQANAVIINSDDDYVMAGYSNDGQNGQGQYDVCVVKVDPTDLSTLVWMKLYGDGDDQQANDIIELSGGGYVLTGYTTDPDDGNKNVLLMKLNSSGVLQWARSYGGDEDEEGMEVLETGSGDLMVVGYSRNWGAGMDPDADVFLMKTNSTGNTVAWINTYGDIGDDYGYSLAFGQVGGYVIAGYRTDQDTKKDVYVIKTNASGESGCETNRSASPTTLTWETGSLGDAIELGSTAEDGDLVEPDEDTATQCNCVND